MTTKESNLLAEALRAVFISPNEADSNLEPANIVDALCMLSRAINRLATAIEQKGDKM